MCGEVQEPQLVSISFISIHQWKTLFVCSTLEQVGKTNSFAFRRADSLYKHCADLQTAPQRLLGSCPQHSYYSLAIAASWLGNHGHIWTAEFFPQLHLAPPQTSGELQGVTEGRTWLPAPTTNQDNATSCILTFNTLIHSISERNLKHALYHFAWESPGCGHKKMLCPELCPAVCRLISVAEPHFSYLQCGLGVTQAAPITPSSASVQSCAWNAALS